MKTKEGHFFGGSYFIFSGRRPGSRDIVGGCWWPSETEKIGETGESGLQFGVRRMKPRPSW